MNKKKKITLIAVIVAVIIIAVIIFIPLFKTQKQTDNTNSIYVSSVSEICGLNGAGMFNRFSGLVEPQETLDIEKNPEKTIKEILVSPGDEVKVGTPLFEYDTEEIALKLSQAELDLETIENDMNSLKNQISVLEKEKAKVSADEKLSYTTQIQEAENELSRAEYNKKSKKIEIEQIKKSLDHTTVVSEIDGVVKSINPNGEFDSMTGQEMAFMTIMATGNYRIKGTINEMNAMYLSEMTPVLIRSRIDDTAVWTGTISRIDFENPNQSTNEYYFGGGNNEQSTSYPFYVELDSSENLILGQHVFIEPDMGQTTAKEGLWLPEDYLTMEDTDSYIWVMNKRNKLEKRKIELGDYDADMMEYQILSGLAETDYIAWPSDDLTEGADCIANGSMEVTE